MMAVVNNSFFSFLLTWRQVSLVSSCCETSPLSDTSDGLPLVILLSGSLPCQHLLHLLFIIACLPHRSVSSSPLSFWPHACEICTCQMLCFPTNLCWFLASCWSVSDSMGVYIPRSLRQVLNLWYRGWIQECGASGDFTWVPQHLIVYLSCFQQ